LTWLTLSFPSFLNSFCILLNSVLILNIADILLDGRKTTINQWYIWRIAHSSLTTTLTNSLYSPMPKLVFLNLLSPLSYVNIIYIYLCFLVFCYDNFKV
jgi:hypothetical protein